MLIWDAQETKIGSQRLYAKMMYAVCPSSVGNTIPCKLHVYYFVVISILDVMIAFLHLAFSIY